jgi:hypothetical protein
MNRFGAFLVGLGLGVALTFVSLRYHVVRASDSFHLVARQGGSMEDLYVDIREFDLKAWNQHRTLAIDLIAAKKEHLIGDSASSSISKKLDGLFGSEEE